MGSIYAFTSKSKPWVKLGMTVNSPIGRIEDYNSTHGTDFDVDSLCQWMVPDCVCLSIEQSVHKQLEANDFDRIRKGSANEIFTFAGRDESAFIEVVRTEILSQLQVLMAELQHAIKGVEVIYPEVFDVDERQWGMFVCPNCAKKLAAPLGKILKITCPKCQDWFFAELEYLPDVSKTVDFEQLNSHENDSDQIHEPVPISPIHDIDRVVEETVRVRKNGMVWWSPNPNDYPILNSVRMPTGIVTETDWLSALAYRIQQIVNSLPEPGKTVKSAAQRLNQSGCDDIPWGPARSAGQIFVTGNHKLINAMRKKLPKFPIAVSDELDDLANKYDLLSFDDWLEAASSIMHNSD